MPLNRLLDPPVVLTPKNGWEKILETMYSTFLPWIVYLCTCCILRCLVCVIVSCLVCIVVVVLCVLLSSYMY